MSKTAKNSEGYSDPTAHKAISNVKKAEKAKDKARMEAAISSARKILKKAGFELIHIVVRNIKTVKIYRRN